MALGAFWDEIFYPIRSRAWSYNTRCLIRSSWKNYLKPTLGAKPLKDINKAMVEALLGKLADKGLSTSVVDSARRWLKSALEEAVENEYIVKNPARKVKTPPCNAT